MNLWKSISPKNLFLFPFQSQLLNTPLHSLFVSLFATIIFPPIQWFLLSWWWEVHSLVSRQLFTFRCWHSQMYIHNRMHYQLYSIFCGTIAIRCWPFRKGGRIQLIEPNLCSLQEYIKFQILTLNGMFLWGMLYSLELKLLRRNWLDGIMCVMLVKDGWEHSVTHFVGCPKIQTIAQYYFES